MFRADFSPRGKHIPDFFRSLFSRAVSGIHDVELYRLLKNSLSDSFASGHDFSRADKPFNFDVPSGLQSARNLPFGLFQQHLFSRRHSFARPKSGHTELAMIWPVTDN